MLTIFNKFHLAIFRTKATETVIDKINDVFGIDNVKKRVKHNNLIIDSEYVDYLYTYRYKLLPIGKDLWVCPICFTNLVDQHDDSKEESEIVVDPLNLLGMNMWEVDETELEEEIRERSLLPPPCFTLKEKLTSHLNVTHKIEKREVKHKKLINFFQSFKLRATDGMLQRYWVSLQKKQKKRNIVGMKGYWRGDGDRISYFIELLQKADKIDVEDSYLEYFGQPSHKQGQLLWKELTEDDDQEWIDNEESFEVDHFTTANRNNKTDDSSDEELQYVKEVAARLENDVANNTSESEDSYHQQSVTDDESSLDEPSLSDVSIVTNSKTNFNKNSKVIDLTPTRSRLKKKCRTPTVRHDSDSSLSD